MNSIHERRGIYPAALKLPLLHPLKVFNAGAVLLLRLPVKEAIAVLIMGSQKSAPVAVTVISYIPSDTRQRGLLSVPATVGQLTQIFMGCARAPAS